jgi:hypothetical protein
MRFLVFLPVLLFLSALHAADPSPAQPGRVISAPDFRQPLGSEWSVAKGSWVPKDGVLVATEISDEKHSAVLHLTTGPVPLVFECEFRFNGGKVFYVGCDGDKHVGRVVVTAKSAKLCEDSTEVKGKTPSHVLAEVTGNYQRGEWQKLRIEYSGDQMTAHLNDQELKAQHPYLATPKKRWWFAAGGQTVEIRSVKVTESK